MAKFTELNAHNSTIVTVEGTEYRTTQEPHVSDDGRTYKAHAVDAQDNEYIIAWAVINEETTDESEACDWANPSGVMAL